MTVRRSSALAPLSRDHHHALVVARALSRAGPVERPDAVRRFIDFLAEHELRHFALEEAVLLPLVPDAPPGPALRARLIADHTYLRDALSRWRDAPEAATLAEVQEVGKRLRAHVHMEERELFPLLEASLDAQQLSALADRLA